MQLIQKSNDKSWSTGEIIICPVFVYFGLEEQLDLEMSHYLCNTRIGKSCFCNPGYPQLATDH